MEWNPSIIDDFTFLEHVAVLSYRGGEEDGTMADNSSDDSTSTSIRSAAVIPTSSQPLSNDAQFSTNSTSPQVPVVQLQQQQQQPLPCLTAATLLDVQQLDDYLLRLVLSKLQQLVHTYYGSSGESTNNTSDSAAAAAAASSKTSSWLWPALQLITLWLTQGQTPAVRLLGLRVDVNTATEAEAGGGTTSPTQNAKENTNASTRVGLLRYSVLGILVPYLYQKLKDWKTSVEVQEQQQDQQPQESPAPPTHQDQQQEREQVAKQRRLQLARLLIRVVDTILPGVKLFVLLTTWSSTGEQVVPPNNIAARLCQWKYHTAQSQQPQNRLHVDFAHRRWLYDCLMQTSRIWWAGLFLLPPVWGPDVQDYMVSPVTRVVRDLSDRASAVAARASALVFSPKTVHANDGARQRQRQKSRLSCPICRRTDTDAVTVTVPVQGNCADTCRQIYCYACLYAAAVRSRSRSNSKVYCRTCREIITSCRFVDVQVEVEAALGETD